MLIYLADLTHTGQLVASNVFPLGIGLIGANIMREITDARVELFKYPQDLDQALTREVPDVVGFSNYSWSCNIGMEYAKRIKAKWPEVVVIAGGPNYGSSDFEHDDYWRRFPFVDYYIVKEGENACVQLLSVLSARNWRTGPVSVPSCHYLEEGRLATQALAPRIRSLDDLPSPYTTGLMDKMFDGVLIPLVHWTRGCPFACTFCTEGQEYYNKTIKRTDVRDEFHYIAQHAAPVVDMYVSNANVGMFPTDREVALILKETQEQYGYPEYIHCSGGKNRKDLVLEFAKIIGGRMGVSASLQSTSKHVLSNVKRDNISHEQLIDVARQGSRIDANTFAEIILNLPGDTLEAHTQSLRDCVNSGVSYLRMYQLIMLPETEMNTQETREKFGLKTMWRIMPRCFGRYTFQGEEFNSAEIEEICIAQDSLQFFQYIEARELDLSVEIFHNANGFRELFGLCSVSGIEWFDLLLGAHVRKEHYLRDLYTKFREDTIKPLWESREEALAFAQGNLDQYLTEQLGTNELFNAKATAFFTMQQELHDAIYAEAVRLMPQYGDYLEQCKDFSLQRKSSLLDTGLRQKQVYDYDFAELLESDFAGDPEQHRRTIAIDFSQSADQRTTIDQLVHQYGTSTTGLGRILLRAHVKKLFRNITVNGVTHDKGFETSYRRSSNLYGD
jgi:radical SAM superfamily enzyme YgiQ (UPF0313 family)